MQSETLPIHRPYLNHGIVAMSTQDTVLRLTTSKGCSCSYSHVRACITDSHPAARGGPWPSANLGHQLGRRNRRSDSPYGRSSPYIWIPYHLRQRWRSRRKNGKYHRASCPLYLVSVLRWASCASIFRSTLAANPMHASAS